MACIVSVQFALLSGIQPTGISHQKQISPVLQASILTEY